MPRLVPVVTLPAGYEKFLQQAFADALDESDPDSIVGRLSDLESELNEAINAVVADLEGQIGALAGALADGDYTPSKR